MGLNKFWMVLGKGDPVYKHGSRADACKEAERLARLCPGHTFTVLESVATVVAGGLKWDRHDTDPVVEDENVPF